MARAPLLQLSGISLTFGGDPVFDNLDLVVHPGDRVALVGRNGSGKSTLMKVMAGLVDADSGSRVVPPGVTVGYMEQDPDLSAYATLGDYAAANLPDGEEYKVAMVAEGLKFNPETPVASASGGERRRLELARALTTDPDYLLLDEPFTGVDPKSIREIQRLIRELRDRRGLGVFITDHNVRETIALTDRVYLMFDGTVKFEGTPAEFAQDEDARRHYLGDDFEL